jgi:hypothetical protein
MLDLLTGATQQTEIKPVSTLKEMLRKILRVLDGDVGTEEIVFSWQ